MTAPVIREARLPEDRPAILSFIHGLQVYERAIEPDRRTDDRVAAEFYDYIVPHALEHKGRIFIAELGGAPMGWAVFHEGRNHVYVHEDERVFGYVAELFVEEEARGRGAGRALIRACEDAARALGHKVMLIGVLERNTRTAAIYEKAGYAPYSRDLRKYLR